MAVVGVRSIENRILDKVVGSTPSLEGPVRPPSGICDNVRMGMCR